MYLSNTPVEIDYTYRMSYFVYILQCADGSLYTGITNDLERRLEEHKNKKGGHYTRAHGAKKIIYTEKLGNRSQALKREAEIKSWRKAQKLSLINAHRKARQ